VSTTLELRAGGLDELRAALRDGRLDDERAAALVPLAAPEWALRIEIGDAVAEAWIAAGRLVLHAPGDAGGDRLALLGADLLAGTLAELADLGPRPHAEGAAPVRVRAGDLALAIAGPAAARGALATVVRTLRVRWRVEARRARERRVVEVLDTADGLWLLMPDGAEVDLVPVTPTRVFRLLVALVG
jgi:hypothetical protein